MRDLLRLKHGDILNDSFEISEEREAELFKIIADYAADGASISAMLEFAWNNPDISDKEFVLIALGIGQRTGVAEYQRRMEAFTALAGLARATGGNVH